MWVVLTFFLNSWDIHAIGFAFLIGNCTFNFGFYSLVLFRRLFDFGIKKHLLIMNK